MLLGLLGRSARCTELVRYAMCTHQVCMNIAAQTQVLY